MVDLDRRGFLGRGAALIGCSVAAHPLMTSVTLAAAPWDARLVVIILRGGMDGLAVVQPVGDPDYAQARAGMIASGDAPPIPLDGFYAMHPALAPLKPLWDRGQLAFAHAVSTPYRNKRSHFDGQDMLEAGTGMDVAAGRMRDGWLNRMLQTVPGVEGRTAFVVGRERMKILEGRAPVAHWSPDAALDLNGQARLLLEEVYRGDPLFDRAARQAIELAGAALGDDGTPRSAAVTEALTRRGGGSTVALAAFAAEQLYRDTRIASFSLSGWDTHRDQGRNLPRALGDLADVIEALRAGLGPVWDKTTVLAMTEFGRTARENGNDGTDHGTGGAMLMAGGAVRGGRVHGRWPGLSEAELFDRRDLMPTGDVRGYAAWAMRSLYGIDRGRLTGDIFPGLDLGEDPGLIL
ncbi:DUF1501 domain-containing protein [Palleronia sediminis]|uniref:DUF1501 domain-containing protein n=1 Tax=Palleronia sediminis TaxID=2547833 RepID=A0A4R6A0Y0_9RHOB|nr:DUF1501 domain-containing protein [Palleronia sediminis]TDL76047.1 DUF1501 domain-containing protein [Palleronia sediminis]